MLIVLFLPCQLCKRRPVKTCTLTPPAPDPGAHRVHPLPPTWPRPQQPTPAGSPCSESPWCPPPHTPIGSGLALCPTPGFHLHDSSWGSPASLATEPTPPSPPSPAVSNTSTLSQALLTFNFRTAAHSAPWPSTPRFPDLCHFSWTPRRTHSLPVALCLASAWLQLPALPNLWHTG